VSLRSTEVRHFDGFIWHDKNIRWFNISMCEIIVFQLHENFDQIQRNRENFFIAEGLLVALL